ncbi:MAG TPA: ornithine carbamoyltransferase [Acidimicrobiales bacterium]|nr:ornithine carbamoyltransferase [Acidimicrobiales bacterium]
MTRHFLEVDDLDAAELALVLDLADRPAPDPVLTGRGMAMIFEKPSNRTRNSTEMAVVQLGGHPVYLQEHEVGMDTRETVEDVARTLAGYHAVIGARVNRHLTVERLAAASSVPVVNLLSDEAHPCQALADLLTIRSRFGGLAGRTVAYVGDANNVFRSLAIGCALAGAAVRVASPPGHAPDDADADRVRSRGGDLTVTSRPEEAVEGADVVYTDVWTSMGQEAEAEARRRTFEGFTVDATLMGRASADAVFLHCLPAHRGEEVAGGVLESPASLVWEQAANRMHAMRGILLFLLGVGR